MLFGNISFDIAALMVIAVIFVWCLIEKKVPLKSYNLYVLLVSTVFAASGATIITELMAHNGYEDISFLISLSATVLVLHLIPLFIMWYISELMNIRIHNSYILSVVLIVVIIASTNPLTKFCIEYSAEGYIFHWGSNILFFFDIVHVLVCFWVAYKRIKEITIARFWMLTISIILCWFGLMAQIIWMQNMMTFCMALTSLSLYQYLLNPATMTDNVTGVFSKKFMSIYLKKQFTEKKTFGAIVVSLDDFSFINKTYGIESGDELLRQVGSYLQVLQANKLVFRMDADQFCVIVEKDNQELAEKLEERFKQLWDTSKHTGITLSATICCISNSQNASNYEELMDIIDYAVSVTKATNKGHINRVEDLELDKQHEKKTIENAVKQALNNDGLMVYYQPIFSIKSGCYNSAEALVRLNSEKLGWISPEIFIPIAEKNGLINQLGEIVLNKVCELIHEHTLSDSAIEYIEVNISTVQVAQKGFVEQVKEILEKWEVQPQQINMEITETAEIASQKVILENIKELMDYGITFSLDDYGSGNANIDYINQMPFSIVKIDKYIIWDALKSEKAKVVLEHTIAMLQALQLYIVAEGVETKEMKEWLEKLGCDYMQGWYYSKAIPDKDFLEVINNIRA